MGACIFVADELCISSFVAIGTKKKGKTPKETIRMTNKIFRYCLTMMSGDSVSLKQDGRPSSPSKGIVAINTAGVWKPVCTEKWDDVSTFSLQWGLEYRTSSEFECSIVVRF